MPTPAAAANRRIRPLPTEHAAYYGNYIALVPDGDILTILAAELERTTATLARISEADSLLRHAPYTWSTREVVNHLADAERIFGYRALRVARADATPLPGFDENAYAVAAAADRIPLRELAADFATARRANLSMLGQLQVADWGRAGTANGYPVTLRALAFIMAGHERHHAGILRTRLSVP